MVLEPRAKQEGQQSLAVSRAERDGSWCSVAFSILFSPGSQPTEGCYQHLGWVFPFIWCYLEIPLQMCPQVYHLDNSEFQDSQRYIEKPCLEKQTITNCTASSIITGMYLQLKIIFISDQPGMHKTLSQKTTNKHKSPVSPITVVSLRWLYHSSVSSSLPGAIVKKKKG